MQWWKRLTCWLTDHIWWEHWKLEKIDHCVRCGKERPHRSAGCICTICRTPGGLEGFKAHHIQHATFQADQSVES